MPIRFTEFQADTRTQKRLAGLWEKRKMVAVLGTGISSALFDPPDKNSKADWLGFLRELSKKCIHVSPNSELAKTIHELLIPRKSDASSLWNRCFGLIRHLIGLAANGRQATDPEKTIAVSGYLGLAYSMKQILESHKKQNYWAEAVTNFFEPIHARSRKNSAWVSALKKFTERGILATTNYDQLVDQELQCLALYYSEMGNSEITARRAKPGADEPMDPHFLDIAHPQDYWAAQKLDLLEPGEGFNHHLHGFWSKPETLVLDAADYHGVKGNSADDKIREALIEDYAVIFCGVGEGMLDPHFQRLLSQETDPRVQISNRDNVWFLPIQNGISEYQALKAQYGDSLDALEKLVSIVEYDATNGEKFDTVPKWLCGLIELAKLPAVA